MKNLLVAVLVAFTMSSIAKACEYCFLAEHGYIFSMNQTSVFVDTRYQYFSGLTQGTSYNDQAQAYFLSAYTTIAYARERWGFTLSVPYVHRIQENTYIGSPSLHFEHIGRQVSSADSTSVERNAVEGIGDMSALMRYAVLHGQGDTFTWLYIQGGFKFPTGAWNARDRFGYLLDPELQAGTGTGDFLVGAAGSYGDFIRSASASVLVGIPVRNSRPYQEGASVNFDATYQGRIFPDDAEDGPMLIGSAGIFGKVAWKDHFSGAFVDASGGYYIFFSGGFTFMPVPGLKLEILMQVPVLIALDGAQLQEQFRIVSGIQVSL
ncbi:MAG TPA: hypothetical protein VL126_01770 [Bacteroidota bacterium]|nr:hypothetical protein [Bacteroidota bacterium]